MKPDKERTSTQRRLTKGERQARVIRADKPISIISATLAARTFSDLLNRVRYRGEAFVVERGGEPICEISPVKPLRFTGSDLLGLLRSLPKPDRAFWDAVEEATRQPPSVPKAPWGR